MQPTWLGSIENVRTLVVLLSCVANGKKDQRIRCEIDMNSVVFLSQSKGKSLHIKSTISKELFRTFELPEDTIEDGDDPQTRYPYAFCLDAALFLECLSVFGSTAQSHTSIQLAYYEQNCEVELLLEERGVICECNLHVLEEDTVDIDCYELESCFENSDVVGRCIIQSRPLRDAFMELYDLPSAASVTISMQQSTSESSSSIINGLFLRAESRAGSCEIAFRERSDAFIELECKQLPGRSLADSSFHVVILQHAFKALGHATESFLRMTQNGMLSVQHMILTSSGERAFVDALICPEDS
uniref:Uncharacterized protein AlNc14C21G2190 n=1 Tax=Albugo laibachii Nc14 TaxID=890382 RepID=F0W5M5_9STRA|nr:conserved hypothetical protein [Albugo laibachii Nc14]|eukprot:CCA16416.1 conserved hypothetical protein [Albugo laibachii Nc14]